MPSLVEWTSNHHIRSGIVLIPKQPLSEKHELEIPEDLLHTCRYWSIPDSYHFLTFAGSVSFNITTSLTVRNFWSSSAVYSPASIASSTLASSTASTVLIH